MENAGKTEFVESLDAEKNLTVRASETIFQRNGSTVQSPWIGRIFEDLAADDAFRQPAEGL
ncbi:MAG: hypothetical protein AB7U75_18550 [Hyphomicrobiaceae bacterium]